MRFRKQVLIGAGCGLLVGILVLSFMKGGGGRVPQTIWALCNGPALLLSYGLTTLWHALGLGPHGEAGWDVLLYSMWVAIVIQWVVIGAIVGLLVARRHFKWAAAICGVLGIGVLCNVLWFPALRWAFMDPTEAKFMKIGGLVTVDELSPDKPIVEIQFTSAQATDAGLEQLKGLSQLRKLGFSFCPNVTGAGLANIKGLNRLVEISFIGNEVTDAWLEHLNGFTQLQSLRLSGCGNVTDAGLKYLEGLANLQKLDLEFCTGITDTGIAHLKGLTHLKNLSLCGTKIGADGLAHLKGLVELQSLNLDSCVNVTDAGLPNLKGLTTLKSLSLWHIPHGGVTDVGVNELKAAIPNLEVSGIFSSLPARQRPNDSKAHIGEPAAAHNQQQPASKEQIEFQRALEANPNDAEAYYQEGLALAKNHKLGRAASQFTKAIKLKPDYAEAHYQLGLALAGLGEFTKAIREYRKALKLKPDYKEARHHLNDAIEMQDRGR